MNTIEPDYFIKDDRYSIDSIEHSDLIIEVFTNRFRFTVRNRKSNLIMWLEDYYLDFFNELKDPYVLLKDIISSHNFLSANYWYSITLNIDFGLNVFVPNEIFDSTQNENYFKIDKDKIEFQNYVIQQYSSNTKPYTLVSAFPKPILSIFNEIYPNKAPIIRSMVNELITYYNLESSILIHFDSLNILCFIFDSNQNLKDFQNIKRNIKDSELIHFFENLKIQNPFVVNYSGEITVFSSIFLMMESCFDKLQFLEIKKGIIFSHHFQELPEHRYISTYSSIEPL